MKVYVVEMAGEEPGQVAGVFQVEAHDVTVECADTNCAYFSLLDKDGMTVAAIPFGNVRSIVHFLTSGAK